MSKYSTLPDIDTAPDLYETPDLPPISTKGINDLDSDEELNGNDKLQASGGVEEDGDEGLQREGMNFDDAKKRFANTRGGQRSLPSTSSYTFLPKSKYPQSNASMNNPQEQETNLEKLRRLRFEVEELESVVQLEKSTELEGNENKEKVKNLNGGNEVSTKIILQQLKLLKSDLATISLDLPAIGQNQSNGKDTISKSLHLFSSEKDITGDDNVEAEKKNGKGKERGTVEDGELERRITELEKLIGISEASIDESDPLPPPLQKTLQKLESLLTLLTQPRHLDTISRRVKVLVNDLERLVEARKKLSDNRPLEVALSGGMSVISDDFDQSKSAGKYENLKEGESSMGINQIQKINSLFQLLPRIDPLLSITPKLLSRLRSLTTLHSSAQEFSNLLLELKDSVDSIDGSEKEIKVILERLEIGMTGNEILVKSNLEGIEGRLVGLMERIDKLAA